MELALFFLYTLPALVQSVPLYSDNSLADRNKVCYLKLPHKNNLYQGCIYSGTWPQLTPWRWQTEYCMLLYCKLRNKHIICPCIQFSLSLWKADVLRMLDFYYLVSSWKTLVFYRCCSCDVCKLTCYDASWCPSVLAISILLLSSCTLPHCFTDF